MKKQKIIVVGVNHSGTNAIKAILQNHDADVTGYEVNDNISFLGCGISLWIQGLVTDPKKLFYANKQKLEAIGAKIHMNHEVISIDKVAKTIKVKNIKTNEITTDTYDKLIASLGSLPIVPPFPGINLKRIYLSKFFHQAAEIAKMKEDPKIKKVGIIGGGYIGCELAEALNINGKEVHLFDMNDTIMKRYYDLKLTKTMETAMTEHGIKFHLETKINGFKGLNGTLSHIDTSKGDIALDAVILVIGFKSNSKILKGVVDLEQNGAVTVNKFLQTSDPDIYSIGDGTAINNNFCYQKFAIALATTAVKTGIVGGINAVTGNTIKFPGMQGANAIKIFGWNMCSVGMAQAVAEFYKIPYKSAEIDTTDLPDFMDEKAKRVILKIIYHADNKRIMGVQLMGRNDHTELIYFFSYAIEKKLKITELWTVDMHFNPWYNKPINFVMQLALREAGIKVDHQI